MRVIWTEIKPAPAAGNSVPCSRSSHGVSFIEGNSPRIVVFGGEHIARTPITTNNQSTWSADYFPTNDSWKWRPIVPEAGGPSPPPRVAHSQAVIDNKVYIFGGRMGIKMDEKPLHDMWVLDASGQPGTESWSEVTYADGSTPPEARSFHKMVAIGTKLYIFGGCGAPGRLADLHSFDTKTMQWTNFPASSVLKGRGGANLIVLEENKLAVVAGFAGEETNDGHVFACDTDTWEDAGMEGLNDMRKRSVCVSASLPAKGVSVIFGGEVDPSDRGHEGAGGFADDVVLLDLKSGSYKESINKDSADSSWPEQRGWSDGDVGQVGSSGPCLFMFGGLSGDDKAPRRLADLWQCEIEE